MRDLGCARRVPWTCRRSDRLSPPTRKRSAFYDRAIVGPGTQGMRGFGSQFVPEHSPTTPFRADRQTTGGIFSPKPAWRPGWHARETCDVRASNAGPASQVPELRYGMRPSIPPVSPGRAGGPYQTWQRRSSLGLALAANGMRPCVMWRRDSMAKEFLRANESLYREPVRRPGPRAVRSGAKSPPRVGRISPQHLPRRRLRMDIRPP